MPRWRRRSNGYVVFVALLVLLSAAAAIRLTLDDHGFSLLKTPPGEAVALDTSQHALTVTAVHPRQLPWRDSMQVFGPVEPWQEAVIAAQVPGLRLARLDADVGDIVARSQVLARYDDEPLRHHRDQIAANLAEAKASAREAVSTFGRSRRMLGGGGISEQDFVRAKSDSEIARARVDALRAQLAAAELQIRQARILAPDDGVVSARAASIGTVASEGQELFRLIRQSRLEWRGQLTAAQAARLRGQEAVELQLPDDSTAQARLRAVSPGFDTQTRLLTVYADVLPGSSARAGMYAGGRILLDVRPAIAVPAASIVIRDGRSHVFVLSDQAGDAAASGEAVARQTPVRTGRRQEGWIEVLDALAEDAQVVADGAGLLQDGDRVRVAAGARREE